MPLYRVQQCLIPSHCNSTVNFIHQRVQIKAIINVIRQSTIFITSMWGILKNASSLFTEKVTQIVEKLVDYICAPNISVGTHFMICIRNIIYIMNVENVSVRSKLQLR